MTANMYRVGDYVYFETSSSAPYLVRRIEELSKTTAGNVEARVVCFYRRRDLPTQLTQLADRHQTGIFESIESQNAESGTTTVPEPFTLSQKQMHQMKHRELFLTRQLETLPATHIRGKCSVTLFNETESLASYLNKDDTFFYCLVFDPQHKTLLADKGEIRVGGQFQCDMSSVVDTECDNSENQTVAAVSGAAAPIEQQQQSTGTAAAAAAAAAAEEPTTPAVKPPEQQRTDDEMETLVWSPHHNLTDRQIDQFLVVSRSVGTFARALDCSSSVKQPSLHMSAAAASRDITLFHAMDTLHQHKYDVSSALCSLVPSSGPVLCRDEMEEWSASEANLFEEALDKYGKDFNDIRHDFLPWKTMKNVVEYYYMWKTTDRYVQQKRVKAVEAEAKLKQIYIPNYNKPNPAQINNGKGIMNGNNGSIDASMTGGKPCESCNAATATQWYAFGAAQTTQCRVCHNCWQYWKKYGGLKKATRFTDTDYDLAAGGPPPMAPPPPSSATLMSMSCVPAGTHSIAAAAAANLGLQNSGGGLIIGGSIGGGGGVGGTAAAKRRPGDYDEERSPSSQHRQHRCNVGHCGKEFKLKLHLVRHYATAHNITVRSTSPRPIMKTRTAFYLYATPLMRLSRRLCRHIMRPRHAARAPCYAINIQAMRQECAQQMVGRSIAELKELLAKRTRSSGVGVTAIATRLGNPGSTVAQWLILTDKASLPAPEHVAFPRPPKAPDGTLLYERIPNKVVESEVKPPLPPPPPPLAAAAAPTLPVPLLKRRTYDDMNGIDSGAVVNVPPTKKPFKETAPVSFKRSDPYSAMTPSMMPVHVAGMPRQISQINGKPKIAHMTRTGSGRKQVISWMDAPDDVYYRATDDSKRIRRQVPLLELRRAARKPWRSLATKSDDKQQQIMVLD